MMEKIYWEKFEGNGSGPYEQGYIEASALGLKPGRFPLSILIEGARFACVDAQRGPLDPYGELRVVNYELDNYRTAPTQRTIHRRLSVFND